MYNIDALKDQLIDSLWFAKARDAGATFYSRRKNKRMRLLTLTNGINFNEILKLEEGQLIQRADIVAWVVSDFNKRMRLEVESVGCILEGDILTETILDASSELHNHFPRDIINLDFSSQDPNMQNGRIEQEMLCLEKNINIQKQKGGEKFVVIYTTILDSHSINKDEVIRASDALRISEWLGLNLSNYSENISDISQQKAFIEEVLRKICQKYGYPNINLDNSTLAIPGHQEQLYSIAGIIER